MLDIKKIINNQEYYIKNLSKRNKDYTKEIKEVSRLYELYLVELQKIETNKAIINENSKLIGEYKRNNQDIEPLMQKINKAKEANELINTKDLYNQYMQILNILPNIVDDSCPVGTDEEDNVCIRKVGEVRKFDFEIKAHYELGDEDNKLDFERASKISKSRFVITKGFVARLERAITNYMLDTHTKKGYQEFGVPVVVSEDTMYASGQLPKFKNDAFRIARPESSDDEFMENERDFYLIPTAEVVLANLHRDEILNHNELNLNYTAYSQCFRKEAGSAGKDTRGLIRVHQFGKVELFKYVKPETSFNELENMVNDAEAILQGLELPYQVLSLCTGDMGIGSAKTYDLEVWIPSQNKYRECSSCSNVLDYQARRAKIRYKDEMGNINYPHMLNGSGMATGRILAAVMENYQNQDKTISIPKVLEKYFD